VQSYEGIPQAVSPEQFIYRFLGWIPFYRRGPLFMTKVPQKILAAAAQVVF